MQTELGDEQIMNIWYLSGWICPLCGRVYSPFQDTCLYCNGQDYTITTGTGTGDALPPQGYTTCSDDRD